MGMDLPPTVQLVLTMAGALAGALGLTGMIGPWVVRRWKAGATAEMVEQMKGAFATVEAFNAYTGKWDHAMDGFTARVDREMKDLHGKVDGCVSLATNAGAEASEAHDAADRVAQRLEYLEEQVLPRLDKISDTLIKQGEHISEQTGVLKTFMDEHRSRR
jgi:hypothetical protein